MQSAVGLGQGPRCRVDLGRGLGIRSIQFDKGERDRGLTTNPELLRATDSLILTYRSNG